MKLIVVNATLVYYNHFVLMSRNDILEKGGYSQCYLHIFLPDWEQES